MAPSKVTTASRKPRQKSSPRAKPQARKQSTRSSSRKVAKPNRDFQRVPMPDGRSLLLDLPAELRDIIYELVAAESGAILRKGKLASCSSLTRVSRQVHGEYQSVLAASARLDVIVKDFDFSHVIRFLNKLSGRELHTLPTFAHPSQRHIHITLQISQDCPANPEKLHSWLLRCERPDKRGTSLDAKYKAELLPGRPPYAWSRWVYNTSFPEALYRRPENQALDVFAKLAEPLKNLEDGRLFIELSKIFIAVGDVCRGLEYTFCHSLSSIAEQAYG